MSLTRADWIPVRVLPDEWRICQGVGRLRYEANKAAGTINLKIRDDLTNDPTHSEAEWFAAEVVVAKHLNLYPDLTYSVRSGGADLTIGGMRIDVKHGKKLEFNLVTSVLKHADSSDIYVLVLGEVPQLYITGWCWSDEFIRPENLQRGKDGAMDFYMLDKQYLKPMDTLEEAVNIRITWDSFYNIPANS